MKIGRRNKKKFKEKKGEKTDWKNLKNRQKLAKNNGKSMKMGKKN